MLLGLQCDGGYLLLLYISAAFLFYHARFECASSAPFFISKGFERFAFLCLKGLRRSDHHASAPSVCERNS
jgi:hypothetical protein